MSNNKDASDIKKQIIRELKFNYFNIMKNKYIGRGRKIAMTGMMINEGIYRELMLKYVKSKKKLFKETNNE
jgi:hypothetical protein